MKQMFNEDKPCLVLAPHLEYPLRNGGDILIDRKWAEFSRFVPYVDIVGMNCIVRYCSGKKESTLNYTNSSTTKKKAAIAALCHRSHYHLEKFITEDFKKIAIKYLSNPEYNLIVSSFIWTAIILDRDKFQWKRFYCIETHNNEMILADNHRMSSMNPLVKLVAYYTKKWAMSFLKKYEKNFLYIHVTKEDKEEYLKFYPNHNSCVVPVGVEDAKAPLKNLESKEKVKLIFIGSLGVKMNYDALKVFKNEYFNVLSNALGEELEVLIVGSSPSTSVMDMCKEMGWKLYGDVTEEKLISLIEESTFSFLPFHYVSGGKLKLFKTLVYGIPFLATKTMGFQMDEIISPCVVSDDARDWLNGIKKVREKGISHELRTDLRGLVASYTWTAISDKMYQVLDTYQITGKK